MRKTPACLRALVMAVLLAASMPARAEEAGKEAEPDKPEIPRPTVPDGQFASYDLASVRAGQWLKYETKIEVPGAQFPDQVWVLACVDANEKTVWIETTQWVQMGGGNEVLLAEVERSSRKVLRAWSGRRGGEATAIKVQASNAAETPALPNFKMTGTGSVREETIQVNGTPFPCELVAVEIDIEISGMAIHSTSRTWVSADMHFCYKTDPEPQPGQMMQIEWAKGRKPSGLGGLVRMESEGTGFKSKMTLKAWGQAATRTLRLPDDPPDFKPAAVSPEEIEKPRADDGKEEPQPGGKTEKSE